LLIPPSSVLSGRFETSAPGAFALKKLRFDALRETGSTQFLALGQLDLDSAFRVEACLPNWVETVRISVFQGASRLARIDAPVANLLSFDGATLACEVTECLIQVTTREGLPIAGAVVTLSRLDQPNGSFGGEATDDQGSLSMTLERGTYEVCVTADGFRPEVRPLHVEALNRFQLMAVAAEGTRDSFCGEVVNEVGEVLEGALVSATYNHADSNFGASIALASVRTGADGQFELEVPLRGDYALLAYLKGVGESATAVLPSDSSRRVRIVLEQLYVAELSPVGDLQYLESFDGQFDCVIVHKPSNRSNRMSLPRPPYALPGLPRGSYLVFLRTSSEGLLGAAKIGQSSLINGEKIRVSMFVPATVQGSLVDGQGRPLPGAVVRVLDPAVPDAVPATWLQSRTDRSGRFSCPLFSPNQRGGPVTLQIDDGSQEVTIDAYNPGDVAQIPGGRK